MEKLRCAVWNTDYIDLYFAHWPDPETPICRDVEAHALQQARKIARRGFNLDAQQLSAALEVARKEAAGRQQVLQPGIQSLSPLALRGAVRPASASQASSPTTASCSGFPTTGKYRPQADLAQNQRGSGIREIP